MQWIIEETAKRRTAVLEHSMEIIRPVELINAGRWGGFLGRFIPNRAEGLQTALQGS